jgi:hypothetical protein
MEKKVRKRWELKVMTSLESSGSNSEQTRQISNCTKVVDQADTQRYNGRVEIPSRFDSQQRTPPLARFTFRVPFEDSREMSSCIFGRSVD